MFFVPQGSSFCLVVDCKEPIIHDCIVIKDLKEVALEDNSEGELDGESDVPDEDQDQMVVVPKIVRI
jgi:hypothetical protein